MSDSVIRPEGGSELDAVADPGLEGTSPTACARRLLEAVRADEDPSPYRTRLAGYDEDALDRVRSDPDRALAFWSNCYNAGTQLLLGERPELYESRLRVVRFFGATVLRVAGHDLSLDAIEHGILRGARSKYGLGYLPRYRPWSFERRHRLSDPDPRVHFALNCGAASCPPIRSYEHERIDAQLDLATESYLGAEVNYEPRSGVVRVPELFLWYLGDFGGPSGIRSLLREYDVIPGDAAPSIRFQSWDWKRTAGAYAEQAD